MNSIHLGMSPITERIYAGTLAKDMCTWKKKQDVTNDFLRCFLDKFAPQNGNSGPRISVIRGSSGIAFEISVHKIIEEAPTADPSTALDQPQQQEGGAT